MDVDVDCNLATLGQPSHHNTCPQHLLSMKCETTSNVDVHLCWRFVRPRNQYSKYMYIYICIAYSKSLVRTQWSTQCKKSYNSWEQVSVVSGCSFTRWVHWSRSSLAWRQWLSSPHSFRRVSCGSCNCNTRSQPSWTRANCQEIKRNCQVT